MKRIADDVLEEMAAAARDATPGPYRTGSGHARIEGPTVLVGTEKIAVATCGPHRDAQSIADAEHLAGCDPATIAALVAEIVELRAEYAQLRTRLEKRGRRLAGARKEASRLQSVLNIAGELVQHAERRTRWSYRCLACGAKADDAHADDCALTAWRAATIDDEDTT